MASPQGLCARQRFGGHNENTGYATSLRRAMGSLRVRNSPGESRFALCRRTAKDKNGKAAEFYIGFQPLDCRAEWRHFKVCAPDNYLADIMRTLAMPRV